MNEQIIQEVIRRINAKYEPESGIGGGYFKVWGDGSWEVGYGMEDIRIGHTMDELFLFLEELRK